MGWLLFQCLSVCAAFQLYWRNDWICSRWIVTVLLESFTTLKLVVPLEPLNNVLIISVEMKAEQQCLYNQDLQNQLSIHIFNNCDHKCFKTVQWQKSVWQQNSVQKSQLISRYCLSYFLLRNLTKALFLLSNCFLSFFISPSISKS